ncbi:hypothetical protein FHL15_004666 [Xylaria flabelliformis]|uniref:Uncharacterized protein n=1 Tax=Xylaria flabelliformis TaxID=2512241 RepID=A0A553I2T6_9PEZI|nr:hypothetical protein FHL15_004666 [Xylaria flabelliformis]
MNDAYLRTGRGGAGNFYSHKDVEDAVAKDKTEDIEAQKAPLPIDDNSTAPSTSAPIRSGRGGAGNFISSSTLPSTNTTTSSSSFPPTSTGHPKSPTSASKYSGRGGAGNWTSAAESDGAKRAKEEQEQRRKEALDAGFAQEIRASLPQQPARTYHLHAPGRGRKPEAEERGRGGRVDA